MTLQDVNEILQGTLVLVERVRDGELSIASEDPQQPRAFSAAGNFNCKNIEETIVAGVTILAQWALVQGGPGPPGWSAELNGWLDDWQYNFRNSDARRGFGRLARMLEKLDKEIAASPRIQ